MNPVIGLLIVPVVFFFVGYLFKMIRPYYKPFEFVAVVMVLSILGLVLAFGSTLFQDINFFIQAGLLHVVIYLSFAFIGLITYKIVELMKKKFTMLNSFVQLITMLAVITTMLLLAFSIQYSLALWLYK